MKRMVLPSEPGPEAATVTILQTLVAIAAIALVGFFAVAMSVTIVVRIAVFSLFVLQVLIEFRSGEQKYIQSPVFLLATAALAGFSLLPNGLYTLFDQFNEPEPGRHVFMGVVYRPGILDYFGSKAEAMVLGFCSAALAVHILVKLFLGTRSARDSRRFASLGAAPKPILVISVVLTALYLVASQSTILGSQISSVIHTAYGPLQSFIVIFLLHCAAARQEFSLRIVMGLLLFTVAIMIWGKQGKVPILLVISAAVYYLIVCRVSPANISRATLVVVLMMVLGLQVVQVVRKPQALDDRTFFQSLSYVVIKKLVLRQAETGYCFDNVIKRHEADPIEWSRQLFWLEIMVPRVAWPDKLDFSLGNKYASEFCGIRDAPYHSASITLLGQPIVQGGMSGLYLHIAILLLVFALASGLAMSNTGLARVVIFSLLPWWIDFDQDFAIYAGNIVKFSLIMLPLIVFSSHEFQRFIRR